MSDRAGARCRREYRRLRWVQARRYWRFLAALTAVAVGLTVVYSRWFPGQGALVAFGAIVGAFPFLVAMVLDHPAARRQRNGAVGEELTDGELRRLRRHGWKRVPNVLFEYGDVDHVVCGPGGVVAIETKWTDVAWPIEDGHAEHRYLIEAIDQARDNARRIGYLLNGRAHGPLEVTPMLVIWGHGRPEIDGRVDCGGVTVVRGIHLRQELMRLTADSDASLSGTDVLAVEEQVRTFQQRRRDHEAQSARLRSSRPPWHQAAAASA